MLRKRGKDHDILSCGPDSLSLQTLTMLVDWADIIYSQKDSSFKLKDIFGYLGPKIDTRFDVGPDDWKYPDHPHLLGLMRNMIMADEEWGSRTSDNA